MKLALLFVILSLAVLGWFLMPASGPTPAAQPVAPFARLEQAYRPLMPDDPFGFPLKVHELREDVYSFCGAKPLFYDWVRKNASDWLADQPACLWQHGDIHFGNLGVYACAAERPGPLAFGLVDFDDAHRGPIQVELLQLVVTLRLAAEHRDIDLGKPQLRQLISAVVREYADAAARLSSPKSQSGKTATELLKDDRHVRPLLENVDGKYEHELKKYVVPDTHHFRDLIGKKGDLQEILRRDEALAQPLAAALVQSLGTSEGLQRLLRPRDEVTMRKSIIDVVRRIKPGGAGSQGLRKYLVLIDRSATPLGHDLILYLKQQIPPPADFAGIAHPNAPPTTDATRWQTAVEALADPLPFLAASAELLGHGYSITLLEPWRPQLSVKDINEDDAVDLRQYGRLLAIATGASHHHPGDASVISKRCTAELESQLLDRSAAFISTLKSQYKTFRDDPAAKRLSSQAKAALEAAEK